MLSMPSTHPEKRLTDLYFKEALLPYGWAHGVRIVIDRGYVASIERGVQPLPGDEHHAIGLPGLPNVHSHGFQRGMAGLTEAKGTPSDSFWTWRELMYRFVGRMTPEDVEAITAQAYVEMLEGGFTRVGEFHYIHRDASGTYYNNIGELAERIAASAQTTGICLTLLPVFYAHAGFGGQAPAPEQLRFINSLDQFARLMEASRLAVANQEGIVVGVAAHSLRAVTPEQLAALLPFAAEGPIHIHVAEQTQEVEDCVAWSGRRPVEWLLDNAPVDRRWCLIHATHMTPDETRRMARPGAVAGLCPITEANLGDAIFDAPRFFGARGAFGVGSDSNVLICAAAALRPFDYSQRLANRTRNAVA